MMLEQMPEWAAYGLAVVGLVLTLGTLVEALLRGLAGALDRYVASTPSERDDRRVKPWTRRMTRAADWIATGADILRRVVPRATVGGK